MDYEEAKRILSDIGEGIMPASKAELDMARQLVEEHDRLEEPESEAETIRRKLRALLRKAEEENNPYEILIDLYELAGLRKQKP